MTNLSAIPVLPGAPDLAAAVVEQAEEHRCGLEENGEWWYREEAEP